MLNMVLAPMRLPGQATEISHRKVAAFRIVSGDQAHQVIINANGHNPTQPQNKNLLLHRTAQIVTSNDIVKIPTNCVETTLSWPDTYFFLSSVMHSSMCFSLSDKSEFSFFDNNIFSMNSTCGPSTRFFNWIKFCASIASGFDWLTRRSRRFYRGFKYFSSECSSFA